MKKNILPVLLLCAMISVQAQLDDRSFFKLGFHAALPVGDASDVSNFGIGVDIFQHWGISREFDLGIASGFTNAFVNTEDGSPDSGFDNIQFLPVAGLLRFYPIEQINMGGDIGYAFGLTEEFDGGFYYRPSLSINLANSTQLHLSYSGIVLEEATWSTITGGIIFLF